MRASRCQVCRGNCKRCACFVNTSDSNTACRKTPTSLLLESPPNEPVRVCTIRSRVGYRVRRRRVEGVESLLVPSPHPTLLWVGFPSARGWERYLGPQGSEKWYLLGKIIDGGERDGVEPFKTDD